MGIFFLDVYFTYHQIGDVINRIPEIVLSTGCCSSRSLHTLLQVDNLESCLYLGVLRRCWLAVRLSVSEEHEHKIDLRQDGGEAEHHKQERKPGPGRLGDQGEDVVAKYEQVNGAIADSLDNVIF